MAKWASPDIIEEILDRSRTIAVVGLSDKPHKPSYFVARTLSAYGYRVIGVNPNVREFFGARCYDSLDEIPQAVDLVDVFRRPDALEPVIEQMIKMKIPYLWLQEGVINESAALKASKAGIKVVMNRCIAKERIAREK
jgi:hypothetical protein